MCFQINERSSHVAQCVKSLIINKAIYSILYIETFKQQFVVIEGTLQSPRLEDHMKTIGIDQSFYNKSSFEHKFLNNIKKIYQHSGKCDYQQNIKDILNDAMVSTSEGVTHESPNVPMTSTPVRKPSASKSLFLFTNILNVKKKTEKCRVGAT